jgi:hypothetical protein
MLSPPAKSATVDVGNLAFTLVALLRADGHLCNVLTHISSGDWRGVERALVAILTPRTPAGRLSKVARNILELLCDDRGVTGRIMRPFFLDAIARIAGRPERKRLENKIARLRCRMSLDDRARSAHPQRAPRRSAERTRLGRPAGDLRTAQAGNRAGHGRLVGNAAITLPDQRCEIRDGRARSPGLH